MLKSEKGFITFRTVVSKGTYIRSLIRDIGEYLKVPATMVELERTRQGDFGLNDCVKLIDIKNGKCKLKNIDECIPNFKRIIPDEVLYKKIINGAIIDNIYESEHIVFVTNKNKLLAIYKIYEKDNTKMKPWKMFKVY